VLNALHGFDMRTIDDWTVMMTVHLERFGGATPMQTARYTVDALRYVKDSGGRPESLPRRGTLRLATNWPMPLST
jgi:hypothetical protein